MLAAEADCNIAHTGTSFVKVRKDSQSVTESEREKVKTSRTLKGSRTGRDEDESMARAKFCLFLSSSLSACVLKVSLFLSLSHSLALGKRSRPTAHTLPLVNSALALALLSRYLLASTFRLRLVLTHIHTRFD